MFANEYVVYEGGAGGGGGNVNPPQLDVPILAKDFGDGAESPKQKVAGLIGLLSEEANSTCFSPVESMFVDKSLIFLQNI